MSGHTLRVVGEREFRRFVKDNADAMREEESKEELFGPGSGKFKRILYGNTKSQRTVASEIPRLDDNRFAIWIYHD